MLESSHTKCHCKQVLIYVRRIEIRVESTHRIGTSSSKTAGSTSTHMSTCNKTFKRREPYGASPRHRQKKGLVSQSDLSEMHTSKEFTPPEKIIPLGFHDSSVTLVVHGSSSAKTPRARSRRKIRWLVCEPKSSTRMVWKDSVSQFTLVSGVHLLRLHALSRVMAGCRKKLGPSARSYRNT
jgi:hypothetical protein